MLHDHRPGAFCPPRPRTSARHLLFVVLEVRAANMDEDGVAPPPPPEAMGAYKKRVPPAKMVGRVARRERVRSRKRKPQSPQLGPPGVLREDILEQLRRAPKSKLHVPREMLEQTKRTKGVVFAERAER